MHKIGYLVFQAHDYPEDKTVWANIADEGATSITRDQLKELSDDSLLVVADVFNIPHQQLLQNSNINKQEL